MTNSWRDRWFFFSLFAWALLSHSSPFLWGAPPDAARAAASGDHKKIVFVAGKPSHGYGAHEHNAGCLLLADRLEKAMPGYECVVHRNGWPEEGIAAFDGADSVVIYCDGGGRHLLLPHLDEFAKVMDRGVGLVCIHYAVEVPKGRPGDLFLEWLGGYFETHWSVNPHWTADFRELPRHPIAAGVKPFRINDEWYFHMRFRPGMKGVLPILSAVAPASTMSRPDGAHSGNPAVRAAVKRGDPQHVAWAAERPHNGRSFGFTGGHFHRNWADDNFRKVVLNAIVWTAHGAVPPQGVETPTPTEAELEANQDEPKPRRDRGRKRKPRRSAGPLQQASTAGKPTRVPHDPQLAVANLDVHPELEANLFASEPLLLSPSNIDIDARGRVWVCEIVNYRAHRNRRPAGDRILILEDTDGDGRADKTKVFYQGPDVVSPHGVCVLGSRVIVSVGSKVLCFTDEDGDDIPDKKEAWFTNIGGVQHDHGIHTFLFGPDGKLYFNFGNNGNQICDAQGNPITDLAGNTVKADRRPYQQGMVFRCDLDRSHFETLGWNFRNNWMVAVDSYGTLWQSDNDDDGNRGVRINQVMEFGNYGYVDELTGAGWRTPRTGMAADIPTRHWHQNDPGVVPNLLQTGAGSPTGITVYEGRFLPARFHDQLLHCDAGPSVTRCYRVSREGAGFQAEIVEMVKGTRDQWFRPSDVQVAPDGSVFIADWYDPGVGGHRMGDLDRGRIFRLTPRGAGSTYQVPRYDYTTAEGAVLALKNPNNSVRFLAWQALHQMGSAAEPALLEVWQQDPNSRMKARALWLLGKIPGRGEHYVQLAATSQEPLLRVTALRLARQLADVDALAVAAQLARDPDPLVRRSCAIALAHEKRPQAVAVWNELARQYPSGDRWYLEALGIGARGKWDACLAAYLADCDLSEPAARDIVWRSRAPQTPGLLAKLIVAETSSEAEVKRYFRAFDFQAPSPEKNSALESILNQVTGGNAASKLKLVETLKRLEVPRGDARPSYRQRIVQAVNQLPPSDSFVDIVLRFELKDLYPRVMKLITHHGDRTLAANVTRRLLERGQQHLIAQELNRSKSDPEAIAALLTALGDSSDNRAVSVLTKVVEEGGAGLGVRREAVRNLARLRAGAEWLIRTTEQGRLAADLREAAAAGLQTIPWKNLRAQALQLYPAPPGRDERPLPLLGELEKRRGNSARGKILFETKGTCAKCHRVGPEGKDVGPSLADIGDKLSRRAMYESILFPSAGISHNYESYVARLVDGNVVTGLLLSETDEEVALKDSEGVVRTIARDDIEAMKKTGTSLMPADLYKLLSEQELIDIVEYLTTLKRDVGDAKPN